MSITNIRQLVVELEKLLGERYIVGYVNNTVQFLIKEDEDREHKRKEFFELIQGLRPEINQFFFDVLYEQESETGITYKVEIMNDLIKHFGEFARVSEVQNQIMIDVRGGGTKATLLDAAKSIGKYIITNVLAGYNPRYSDLTFRIRYLTGAIPLILTKENTIVFDGLRFLDTTEYRIIEELVANSVNEIITLMPLKNVSMDTYIFALENLQGSGIIEIENFHPETMVDGHGGAHNYPVSFQVKLIEQAYRKFL
jgi:hypothetical protein